MVLRIVSLLLSSIALISSIEPLLAFSKNQCKSSINPVRRRESLNRPHSSIDEIFYSDKKPLIRCMQSLAVIVASLQVLSAGEVSALPIGADVATPTIATRRITDIPDLSAKFPEVAAFLKDVDLSSRSDEFLSNLPRFPTQPPTGSKLLTTTVRPDMDDVQRQYQQFEEIKKIQWWKNTGLNFGKALEDVQSQLQTLPDELLHLGDRVKSFTPNWQVITGIVGIIFVADILQNSRQLSKTVDEQNLKLIDQETKLDSSNSANKETINVLKTESLKLIVEVDSLIKQLDEKASEISTLNDTLLSISMNINATDSNSKQLLIQYSRQLESAEALIKSLKSQMIEIPKKTAREVAGEYKNQIAVSEKKCEELKLQINRMEEDASSKSTQPNKQFFQSKAAPSMPRFPPISSSFPTSIFSPPVNPLVRQNELQTLELNEMKMIIAELEEKRNDEKSTEMNDLTSQIVTLQDTLSTVEKELGEKKHGESIYFQELNTRLSNMENQINGFIIENKELKEALSIAESELKSFSQRESERAMMEAERIAETLKVIPSEESYESIEKTILLNQLTVENDDLKQRLLNSDERLFDLQQDNLNKLEAAKIMTKQLNARLTEIGVQQENKDGKMLLQVKELEEAKDAAIKQLLEYQSALAALASQRLLGFASEQYRVDERAPVKKAVPKVSKSPKRKVKKTVEKTDLIVADKEETMDAVKDAKPYQLMRKSKKELEEILVSLGISPYPLSPTSLPLSKNALVNLITEQISPGVKI